MNIHEYQAKSIFKRFGIDILRGEVAYNLDEILNISKEFGYPVVLKAQIHAGGRGLAGGIKIVKNDSESIEFVDKILGKSLITPQTGSNGKIVKQIYVESCCDIKREFYFSIFFDRENISYGILASLAGGVNIEEIAQNEPDKICKIKIDKDIGLKNFHLFELANFLNISCDCMNDFFDFVKKTYNMFESIDATLLEINPLVLTIDNKFIPLDCKINIDDSAVFRQELISSFKDDSQEDKSEVIAKEFGLSYVKLDGNIGCMVNGAGLAMGTMDTIEYCGGKSANFLDVGGKASAETVAKAFEIILQDLNVKSVFINIFGGIVRCDRIAEGILQATQMVDIKVPIVVRLDGTNKELAKEILQKSNIKNIYTALELEEGAKLAVELAKGGKK